MAFCKKLNPGTASCRQAVPLAPGGVVGFPFFPMWFRRGEPQRGDLRTGRGRDFGIFHAGRAKFPVARCGCPFGRSGNAPSQVGFFTAAGPSSLVLTAPLNQPKGDQKGPKEARTAGIPVPACAAQQVRSMASIWCDKMLSRKRNGLKNPPHRERERELPV